MVSIPRLPKLPLIPDPLRRIDVPRDLGSLVDVGEEVDPREVGMTSESVERIWHEICELYRSGVHPAIQLTLRHRGATVLDRAIGHARGNGPGEGKTTRKVPVGVDTPFVIFSASKAVTAMVVHLLDQRGQLHIGDAVAEYIPEFAPHDKDKITIAHVLAHKAGVPTPPPEAIDLDNLRDESLILELMYAAKPSSRPGSTLAYHALSGGFILAEVVRRVTGRSIREVLQSELLDPLGFRFCNYGVAAQDVPLVGFSYATGPPPLPPLSNLLERGLGVPLGGITDLMNDPRFLTAIVPSGNVVATANELGRFFELLLAGGELGGVRVFEPRTIRRAVTEQSYHQLDSMVAFPTRFSLGFMLGARWLSIYGPDTDLAFGHLGFTNVLGWADPQRALSAALVTSGKPIFYPELYQLWNVTRRIGSEVPTV